MISLSLQIILCVFFSQAACYILFGSKLSDALFPALRRERILRSDIRELKHLKKTKFNSVQYFTLSSKIERQIIRKEKELGQLGLWFWENLPSQKSKISSWSPFFFFSIFFFFFWDCFIDTFRLKLLYNIIYYVFEMLVPLGVFYMLLSWGWQGGSEPAFRFENRFWCSSSFAKDLPPAASAAMDLLSRFWKSSSFVSSSYLAPVFHGLIARPILSFFFYSADPASFFSCDPSNPTTSLQISPHKLFLLSKIAFYSLFALVK